MLTYGTGCLIDYSAARRISDYTTVPPMANLKVEPGLDDDSPPAGSDFGDYQAAYEESFSVILTAGPFTSPVALVPFFLVGSILLWAPGPFCRFIAKG